MSRKAEVVQSVTSARAADSLSPRTPHSSESDQTIKLIYHKPLKPRRSENLTHLKQQTVKDKFQ